MTTISYYNFSGTMINSFNMVLSSRLRNTLEGECTFEFTVPADYITGIQKYSKVTLEGNGLNYCFRVVRIAKSMNNGNPIANIMCEHISYRLNDEIYNLSKFDFSGSPINCLKKLLELTEIQAGYVDFTDDCTLQINQKCSRRTALMQLVAVLGGEIEYVGTDVNILKHRGSESPIDVMYGKFVSDISVTEEARADTDTYKLKFYKKLDLQVGDMVRIVYRPFGLDVTTRIIAMTYNPYNPFEIEVDVGSYIPTINDSLYKMNQKVNNISDATATVKIGMNIRNISVGKLKSEVLNITIAATKTTYAIFVATLKYNVTKAGIFDIILTFNNNEVMTYADYLEEGDHSKTYSYPFESKTGALTARLFVKSEDGEATLEKMQSIGYIHGAYIAKETPWDGTITIFEEIPISSVGDRSMSMTSISDDLHIDMIEILAQTISQSISRLTIGDSALGLRDGIDFSNCPCVLGISNPTNDTIELTFSNPIYTNPIGTLDYDNISVIGFIGTTPTVITVHDGALELLSGDNLLDGATWEQGDIDGFGDESDSDKHIRTDLIAIDDVEHYFMSISSYALKFANDNALDRFTENQLEFYSEIQLEGRSYKASIYYYGENGYIGAMADFESALIVPPIGTTAVRIAMREVSNRSVSTDDLACFVAKLEVGDKPTLYHWSNKIMLRVDDLSGFNSTVAVSYSDIKCYGVINDEPVAEANLQFERVVYP